jgi:hypothetical protein
VSLMRETLCGDRRAAGDAAGGAAFLERYYCRMWDVSAFMHGVKQRFTQWYNLEGIEEREAADAGFGGRGIVHRAGSDGGRGFRTRHKGHRWV